MGLEQLAYVFGSLGALATAIGVVLIYRQIREGRLALKAELINSLTEAFSKHKKTYIRFYPGGDWESDEIPDWSPDDMADLIEYLMFFEQVEELIRTGALDIDTADRMFTYRFFRLVHHPVVQARILSQFVPYLRSLFSLYDRWVQLRYLEGNPIPYPSGAQDLADIRARAKFAPGMSGTEEEQDE